MHLHVHVNQICVSFFIEQAPNQDPLSSDWQGKRSFTEEEEEPPPPYTEVDPLETVKQQDTSGRRLSDQVSTRRSLTPGMLQEGGVSGSAQSFPVLNRTRSDEPASRHGGHVRISDCTLRN